MITTYAQHPDLTGDYWLDNTPDNVLSLLRSATLLIAVAANRNPYTDPPLTAAETDVFRDATCAQVAAWVTAGIDPTSGAAGEQAPVRRTALLDGSVEYDTKAVVDARARAAAELCPEARNILQQARVLYIPVPLYDDSGALPSWGVDTQPRGVFGTQRDDYPGSGDAWPSGWQSGW